MRTELEQVVVQVPKLGQEVVTPRGDRIVDEVMQAQWAAVSALGEVIRTMRGDYATGLCDDDLLEQCRRLIDRLSPECGLGVDTNPSCDLVLMAMHNHDIDQQTAEKMLGAV